METHFDQSQNLRQYVFRTDNTIASNTARAANTKTINTYQDFVWQKPKDIAKVYITAIGGGGSGGPGGATDGRGGGSGSVSHLLVDADQLPDFLTVRVGFGGDITYSLNSVAQVTYTDGLSTQYTNPRNFLSGSCTHIVSISVQAGTPYKIEAWGGGGGGTGYGQISGLNGYSYGGGGGGYASITDFIPPSNGTLTFAIGAQGTTPWNAGSNTYVGWTNTSVSNVELLFAEGGKPGWTSTPSYAIIQGAGGIGRANNSFTGNTFTSKGGNSTFSATDPNLRLLGSGGGGAGGPMAATYNNNSTSRNGGTSAINGLAGGLANSLDAADVTARDANGLGGSGGGASGANFGSTATGYYGGDGGFPGGGGGTGFYWRGRGGGGFGGAGCVRVTTRVPSVTDATPKNVEFINSGSNTVVYAGSPQSNIALLTAIGGSSGLQAAGTKANAAIARTQSRGTISGLTAFYDGAPVASDSSNSTFLTDSLISSGVTGSRNYNNSPFALPANNLPSTTEFYQSMVESISPLFSSGGSSGGKFQSSGAMGGFGSGGGGGYNRGSYPYGGFGGRGGSVLVIITSW